MKDKGYFEDTGVVDRPGRFVSIATDLDEVELAHGLTSKPLVGLRMLASFVRYEPGAVAPRHAHSEEQIFVALEGEIELTVGSETRVMRRGDAAAIPPGVTHGARALGGGAYQLDIFSPPRQAMLDMLEAKRLSEE